MPVLLNLLYLAFFSRKLKTFYSFDEPTHLLTITSIAISYFCESLNQIIQTKKK